MNGTWRVVAASAAFVAVLAPPPALGGGDPAAWNEPIPAQPNVLVVRNATIWTCGPQGRLENADLLVRNGRIAAIGTDLAAPEGAVVFDAAGKHVTPGLIDAHSHTAITGGVNEGTNITTAEVRIGDVLDPEDIGIYRQLAGGLTAANLLHGSANSIGGQNQVIKLRWGADPEGLRFAGAPPGIKFALGENPKQSNWGVQRRRFPQTRQGVEESIRERFVAALDYRRRWDEYGKGAGKDRVPPRRDLQLEALLEILDGKRLVHAHSYRADEILMLIELARSFGFRVATFQHVLEGYKVADEIAAHGAGASSFSDWWAYKYEVIDAIPWNGALMRERGVVVSFNSDSDELARRLNLEAAKAVRYGGVPDTEALKLVTLNPALQLGIADRVGSLENGKDADFVVWSGDPLSTYTVCEQTWIDGRKYFDRSQDLERRRQIAAERDTLLAKLDKKESKAGDQAKEQDPKNVPPAAEVWK
jgi:imidazolonepropionase-like amidohydrolase